jgi:hypothetical protein
MVIFLGPMSLGFRVEKMFSNQKLVHLLKISLQSKPVKSLPHTRNSRYQLVWTIPIVELLLGPDNQEVESFPTNDH